MRAYARDHDGDNFETPEWVTQALLDQVKFKGNVLEPACGPGAISRVLKKNEYHVISSDIRGEDVVPTNAYGNMDFLDRTVYRSNSFDNVVTNPPYKHAQAFVERALEVSRDQVAMFLKFVFAESARRYQFFKSTPLKYVYVFSSRAQLYPEGGTKPKNGSTVCYAWYIWENGYYGEPVLRWIPPRKKGS